MVISREKMYWGLLLLFCTLLVSWPLFSSQQLLSSTNYGDMVFHLNRIEGIKESLLAGQFPVRIQAWQLGGYGYPVSLFYPDLFLYFPAVLRLCGVPLEIAYHIFCVLLQLVTAFSAWYAFSLLSRSVRIGGFSAVLYVSFWYRLLDLYIRGALGELLALAFFPLLLAAVWELLEGREGYWPLAVLAGTGVIESHVLYSILAGVIFLVLLAVRWRCLYRPACRRGLFLALLFTLLVNLWFIVPFLVSYVGMDFNMKTGLALETKKFWSFFQLLLFQGSLGISSFMAIYVFIRQYGKKSRIELLQPRLAWGIFGCGLFFFIASADVFPWLALQQVPLLGVFITALQFPWRLMGLTAACWAFCGGAGLAAASAGWQARSWRMAVLCLFFCFASILAVSMVRDDSFEAPSTTYTELPSFGLALGTQYDYLYQGMTGDELRNRSDQPLSSAAVRDMEKQGTTISFAYEAKQPETVLLPLLYYPGYAAEKMDGQALSVRQAEGHLLLVDLPAGTGTVRVHYAGLPVFHLAEAISLLSLAGLLGIIWRKRQKNGAFFRETHESWGRGD